MTQPNPAHGAHRGGDAFGGDEDGYELKMGVKSVGIDTISARSWDETALSVHAIVEVS